MWRGAIWVNCNFLLICGLREYRYIDLADEIADKTIACIDKWYHADGSIYDNYHDENVSPQHLPPKQGYTGYIAMPYCDSGWSMRGIYRVIAGSKSAYEIEIHCDVCRVQIYDSDRHK